MKVKHKQVKMCVAGHITEHYIRYIKKHWWSKWELIMDGNIPMQYTKINNEYIPMV